MKQYFSQPGQLPIFQPRTGTHKTTTTPAGSVYVQALEKQTQENDTLRDEYYKALIKQKNEEEKERSKKWTDALKTSTGILGLAATKKKQDRKLIKDAQQAERLAQIKRDRNEREYDEKLEDGKDNKYGEAVGYPYNTEDYEKWKVAEEANSAESAKKQNLIDISEHNDKNPTDNDVLNALDLQRKAKNEVRIWHRQIGDDYPSFLANAESTLVIKHPNTGREYVLSNALSLEEYQFGLIQIGNLYLEDKELESETEGTGGIDPFLLKRTGSLRAMRVKNDEFEAQWVKNRRTELKASRDLHLQNDLINGIIEGNVTTADIEKYLLENKSDVDPDKIHEAGHEWLAQVILANDDITPEMIEKLDPTDKVIVPNEIVLNAFDQRNALKHQERLTNLKNEIIAIATPENVGEYLSHAELQSHIDKYKLLSGGDVPKELLNLPYKEQEQDQGIVKSLKERIANRDPTLTPDDANDIVNTKLKSDLKLEIERRIGDQKSDRDAFIKVMVNEKLRVTDINTAQTPKGFNYERNARAAYTKVYNTMRADGATDAQAKREAEKTVVEGLGLHEKDKFKDTPWAEFASVPSHPTNSINKTRALMKKGNEQASEMLNQTTPWEGEEAVIKESMRFIKERTVSPPAYYKAYAPFITKLPDGSVGTPVNIMRYRLKSLGLIDDNGMPLPEDS